MAIFWTIQKIWFVILFTINFCLDDDLPFLAEFFSRDPRFHVELLCLMLPVRFRLSTSILNKYTSRKAMAFEGTLPTKTSFGK